MFPHVIQKTKRKTVQKHNNMIPEFSMRNSVDFEEQNMMLHITLKHHIMLHAKKIRRGKQRQL